LGSLCYTKVFIGEQPEKSKIPDKSMISDFGGIRAHRQLPAGF